MNVASINVSSVFGKIVNLGASIFGDRTPPGHVYRHRNDWRLARDVRAKTGLSVEEFSWRFDVPVEKVEALEKAEPGTKLDTADRLLLLMISGVPGRYGLHAQKMRASEGLDTRMPSDVPEKDWELIQGARHNLGLSAEEFSQGFGIPASKVEEWDNATPDVKLETKDRLVLSMIFKDPGHYGLYIQKMRNQAPSPSVHN